MCSLVSVMNLPLFIWANKLGIFKETAVRFIFFSHFRLWDSKYKIYDAIPFRGSAVPRSDWNARRKPHQVKRYDEPSL